jgi:hypothetical protein
MIAELYSNGILNEADYQNAPPVIPIQQIPEANDNRDGAFPVPDAPFIVYDFLIPGGYDTEYWNCREEVMFWVYDYDIEKLFEIKNFLYDLFRRFDLSASDINSFDDPGNPYRFQYFDVMMGLPTNATDQILGRSGANMVITYQYTRAQTPTGRFA